MPALQIEKKGPVWVLRMSLPEKMNAMEKDLIQGLIQALGEFKHDPQAKVVLLTGEGKAFCAGGNLSEIAEQETVLQCIDYVKGVSQVINDICRLEKPVVAYVNGFAVGAGFNLALACDLIVASTSAKFIQAFSNVGLIPDLGGLYFLPRLIGMQRAKELVFTARDVGAEEAYAMGLVNRVVEPEQGEAEALALAEQLAARPGRALAFAKDFMDRASRLSLDDVLSYESIIQAVCMQTQDHKEGVEAFYGKRKPVFTGK